MWAAGHLISIEIEFLFKSCPATWLESLSMLGCIDDIHKDPSHASFSSYIPPPLVANDSLALLKSDFMKRDASARHASILVTCFTSEPGGNVQNVHFVLLFSYENLMNSQRCIPFSLLSIFTCILWTCCANFFSIYFTSLCLSVSIGSIVVV